jgi:hypothetical protein
MRTTKTFRVAAKSSNTNSFGLRQYVLVSQVGAAFKVCRSISPGPEWETNQDVQVPMEDGAPVWAEVCCELPEALPAAPDKVVRELFKLRLIDSVRHGDRVTILTPQGQERSGRAVMRSSHDGWVLNGGGRHGTPLLADDSNTVRINFAKH